jgi:hypothetical protein
MFRKAQFSFDLLITLGIMCVIFIALFQFYILKSESSEIIRDKIDAKKLAESLSSRINVVLRAGNGTVSNFMIPTTIAGGKNYSIHAANRRVEIALGNSTISSQIQTSDVSSIDINTKKGAFIAISNRNGQIFIQ